ncbi:hypothetical protein G7046_g8271 [Stylonectria norvegica]|nr:hypothetical protein G7046_g8271 [Stylonectria norvegica]
MRIPSEDRPTAVKSRHLLSSGLQSPDLSLLHEDMFFHLDLFYTLPKAHRRGPQNSGRAYPTGPALPSRSRSQEKEKKQKIEKKEKKEEEVLATIFYGRREVEPVRGAWDGVP